MESVSPERAWLTIYDPDAHGVVALRPFGVESRIAGVASEGGELRLELSTTAREGSSTLVIPVHGGDTVAIWDGPSALVVVTTAIGKYDSERFPGVPTVRVGVPIEHGMPAVADESPTLLVIVRDRLDGRPMAGALLDVVGLDGVDATQIRGSSDADGAVGPIKVSRGRFALRVCFPFYETFSTTIDSTATPGAHPGAPFEVRVELSPLPDPSIQWPRDGRERSE